MDLSSPGHSLRPVLLAARRALAEGVVAVLAGPKGGSRVLLERNRALLERFKRISISRLGKMETEAFKTGSRHSARAPARNQGPRCPLKK